MYTGIFFHGTSKGLMHRNGDMQPEGMECMLFPDSMRRCSGVLTLLVAILIPIVSQQKAS
jgi:hypothetical protein